VSAFSIVVVTYNSGTCIERCLLAASKWNAPVIVIDNASADDTVARVRQFPSVTLVENQQNEGFAAAVNQGFRLTDTPAVLVLNPDAEPLAGLSAMAEAAIRYGAAGGRLVGLDGKEQTGFAFRGLPTAWTLAFEVLGLNRLFPRNPVNRAYRDMKPASDGTVPQPAGAFLMISREAWSTLGGFDERFYPAWFEDVDFCARLRKCGYSARFVTDAVARHEGGHSFQTVSWSARQVHWYVSLLRYSGKQFSRFERAAVALSLCLACVPRALAGVGSQGTASIAVYSKVFWLAIRSIAGVRDEVGVPRGNSKTTLAQMARSGSSGSGATGVAAGRFPSGEPATVPHQISQADGFNG
jgi:N-acetylglucosaminyl-diphospho-decaprenol L-rhamnosyltransferase